MRLHFNIAFRHHINIDILSADRARGGPIYETWGSLMHLTLPYLTPAMHPSKLWYLTAMQMKSELDIVQHLFVLGKMPSCWLCKEALVRRWALDLVLFRASSHLRQSPVNLLMLPIHWHTNGLKELQIMSCVRKKPEWFFAHPLNKVPSKVAALLETWIITTSNSGYW